MGKVFEALGFTVSPAGAYTSPEFPNARWPTRCVFLRDGWFDLLEEGGADLAHPIVPIACLFRSPDIEVSAKAFADVRTAPSYRLERRWDIDLGRCPEAFRLFSLRERVAPVGLAVIEHAWPCADVLPAWLDHPNGARAVVGLVFGGAAPGPAADQCGPHLDLSAFDYLDEQEFEERYGPLSRQVAVRVRVRDLSRTAEALDRRGIAYSWRGEELTAPPVMPLGCAFAFSELAG